MLEVNVASRRQDGACRRQHLLSRGKLLLAGGNDLLLGENFVSYDNDQGIRVFTQFTMSLQRMAWRDYKLPRVRHKLPNLVTACLNPFIVAAWHAQGYIQGAYNVPYGAHNHDVPYVVLTWQNA